MRMPAASAVWYWPVGPLICARESMGWQRSSGINTARILLKKEPSSFSAGSGLTAARACSGWGRGSCFYIKGFEDGKLSWPRTTQEAAELTEEQYHYLMMGLNPLDPRIREVSPSEIY